MVYHEIITRATGCTRAEVDEVETIMRDTVFHSTLDWQTREQLEAGAVLAYTVLRASKDEPKDCENCGEPLTDGETASCCGGRDLGEWVTEHRDELQAAVGRVLGPVPSTASCDCPKSGTTHDHEPPVLDDDDLAEWVANDEGLYTWARGDGVDV